MKRAYSLLTIKSVDDDARVIEGIATTPTPDHMGDIVEPKGAEFSLPLPLLWQHDSGQPIGHVESATVTDEGIRVVARFVKLDEAGPLKTRLDEAWQSVKSGLVRGLSIGFKALEESRINDTWSYRYMRWRWHELSAVTIPANGEATITAVKSADQAQRAASGARPVVRLSSPGASGSTRTTRKDPDMKLSEQIAALEAKRAASVARQEAVQQKAIDEGRSKDTAEKEDFDTLGREIEAIDSELVDLKALEARQAKTAKTVVADTPAAAAASRGGEAEVPGATVVRTNSNVPKGIPFVRVVKSLIHAAGNVDLALMHAQRQKGWLDTPQVVEHLKTAVTGGTGVTSGWASELVYNQNLIGDFIDLLRPQTVLGKMPGLRRVPFNIRVSGVDSGSTANWVGQGKPTPVSKLNTTEVTMGEAKVAGLVVLTRELVRSSDPSAEMLVRDDLVKTIAEFCDRQFLDPNVAASANVSPASITNGVTATVPTGTALTHLRADVQTLFKAFINNNDDPTSCVWIMDPVMALAISLMQNALGQNEFPNLTMNGGTFFGLPVVVSNCANITGSPDSGHMIILAKASDIFFADEGGVEIDASGEASVQMDDAPTNDAATGTGQSLVSMFQTNSVAIRAVRPINWKKRRSTAVSYIKEAAYVA